MALRRRKQVTLLKFGAGNEAVVIFQPATEPAFGKSLVFDRIPSNITWLPLYETSLKRLQEVPRGDNDRLLKESQRIRQMVAKNVASGIPDRARSGKVQYSHDRAWEARMKIVLACWRALEIATLEKHTPPRVLLMNFANELDEMNTINSVSYHNLGPFERGMALLAMGKGHEASITFRSLLVGQGGRMRAFYELLVELTEEMPTSLDNSSLESSEISLVDWRAKLTKLEGMIGGTNDSDRLLKLVKFMQGDVKTIVDYVRSNEVVAWGGNSWIRIVACVLNYSDPDARRQVIAGLADRCSLAIPDERLEPVKHALGGQALKALQGIMFSDSFSEYIMAEIFSRLGVLESPSLYLVPVDPAIEKAFNVMPDDVDFRQACLIRFATSLGFGPGRVQTRPIDDDGLAVGLALKYLNLGFAPTHIHGKLIRQELIDRAPLVHTERSARIALKLCSTREERESVAWRRIQILLWNQNFIQACRWADTISKSSTMLDLAAEAFLRVSSSSKEREMLDMNNPVAESYDFLSQSSAEDQDQLEFVGLEGLSPISIAAVKIAQARLLYLDDRSAALRLICDSLDHIPGTKRLAFLKKLLLVEDSSTLNVRSEDCLKMLRFMSLPGTKRDLADNAALRRTIGLLFSSAVAQEASKA